MNNLLELRDAVFMDKIIYPNIIINRGEILFITGPSGSGKSTLLRLLNGTVSPSSGTVFFKGKDIARLDTVSLRRQVVLVNQSIFLFDKSIRENFAEFYRYREQETPSDEELERYLSLCDADFLLDADCTSMSGGERQRIYLAICISFESEVLLLDEPTSALDEKTGNLLFKNLTKYSQEKGKILVVITHNRDLAQEFGDRIVDLADKAHGGKG